jgi:nitrogen regulatory protein PII
MKITKLEERRESGISLHDMKKVEIIVSGEDEATVAKLMEEANVTGYTIVNNVSGKGHQGFHEGRLLFNDIASLVMFIAVAPEHVITTVAVGMKTLFEKRSGVMFVSDVAVARLDHFSKEI